MFTPPHEFAINIPQILSEARVSSYQRWSWPALLGRAFSKPRIATVLGAFAACIVILAFLVLIETRRFFAIHTGPGAFYELIPYLAMVIPAILLFMYGMGVWLRGCVRFWSESGSGEKKFNWNAFWNAAWSALALRYLQGGGPGCNYPDDQPSAGRRIYHSLTFWGFLLAFASTTSAFVYQDFLHRLPPYPLASLPVILGSLGGVGLVVGTGGLLVLKTRNDRAPMCARMNTLDHAFLGILSFTALTGMLTLALRSTRALGSMLTVHLAIVAALFITAPYGKFVHFLYRSLALVRYEIERASSERRHR